MEQNNNTIVLFAKTPESGTAKSRIAETEGDSRALEIYYELLEATARTVSGLPYHVAYTGSSNPQSLKAIFTEATSFFSQTGKGLGVKLRNAFEYLFVKGYKNICALGTDCPYLTTKEIEDSFKALNEGKNAVIGPTYDGGYYLIGCTPKGMKVFSATQWSKSGLFMETMNIIKEHSLSYYSLKKLHDIDYIEDYNKWKQEV